MRFGPSQKEIILHVLVVAPQYGVTQFDWAKRITRVASRIGELEALGVKIERGWLGRWRLYTLAKGTKTKARKILRNLERARLARERKYCAK